MVLCSTTITTLTKTIDQKFGHPSAEGNIFFLLKMGLSALHSFIVKRRLFPIRVKTNGISNHKHFTTYY